MRFHKSQNDRQHLDWNQYLWLGFDSILHCAVSAYEWIQNRINKSTNEKKGKANDLIMLVTWHAAHVLKCRWKGNKSQQREGDWFELVKLDFDGDGRGDNINFMIKRIKVHTEQALNDPSYRFPGNYGVEKFLEIFSGELNNPLISVIVSSITIATWSHYHPLRNWLMTYPEIFPEHVNNIQH